jgi:hypothetical protein
MATGRPDTQGIILKMRAISGESRRIGRLLRHLPDRRRVLDAAGAPELIEPAGNAEIGFRADIALVDLAVVADVADDTRGSNANNNESRADANAPAFQAG